MSIQHITVTDPLLHEPKGVAAAAVNQVYVSDGAGSGTWQSVAYAQTNADVSSTILTNVETAIAAGTLVVPDAEVYIYCTIADISTAGTILIPIPENSEVIQTHMVLGGTIATADDTVTLKNAADSLIVSETVAFTGSALGDSYTSVPSGNEAIVGPSYLKLATDGASTNTIPLYVTIHLYVTRTL
jgi:hypothetical protein